MSTKLSYTIFKNTENKNRVWVYWFRDMPEFVPGYWNLETEGIDNNSGQAWAANANEWVRAMRALGCTYKQIGEAIRLVMTKQGFEVYEEDINSSWAISMA